MQIQYILSNISNTHDSKDTTFDIQLSLLRHKHRHIWDMAVLVSAFSYICAPAGFELTTNS
jgi:hypothetical protein